MIIKLKQRIILLIIVLFLAACGFKLRGQAAPLPFRVVVHHGSRGTNHRH